MNIAYRKTLIVVMLVALVLIDFGSRILSVGVDLMLAGVLGSLLWPLVSAKHKP
ncbi:hypothetical protein HNR62_000350 [Oceanisphaera litoralis]|uniref:DUF3927 family protein n=1 Tax=Oceanisphaera litoralis TaxID=225144 RepID=UPI0019596D06|nr:DUF3927 family protein [Oceanisphaera litoralis]MBM7454521.1 hypothetical protein [Oceanisphaera litoralis]